MKHRTLLLAFLLLIIPVRNAEGQIATAERHLRIMLHKGILDYRPSELKLDSEGRLPMSLSSVLRQFDIDGVERAWPSFNPADTTFVRKDGQAVTLTDWSNLITLSIPAGVDIDRLLKALSECPAVRYAEKADGLIVGRGAVADTVIPNDTFFAAQWNLRNTVSGYVGNDIGAVLAWDKTTGSSQVKLAIVDPAGVWNDHDDFGTVTGDESYYANHGTFIAGIAAARGNNNEGIAGVDWNAAIHAEYSPGGISYPIYAAITSAVQSGADVMNNSWGYDSWNSTTTEALQDAWKANVVLVQSGIEDLDGADSPHPNCIGTFLLQVQCSTLADVPFTARLAYPYTDITAPGGEDTDDLNQLLFSTVKASETEYDERIIGEEAMVLNLATGGPLGIAAMPAGESIYRWGKGSTSWAAPNVSGVATLMMARNNQLGNPVLKNYDIEEIIKLTADPIAGYSKSMVGAGRLNAIEALERLEEPYYLEHSSASLTTVATNVYVFFESDPFPEGHRNHGYGTGWYQVDVYKLEGSYLTYPFDKTPEAWLSQTGFKSETTPDPESYNYEYTHKSLGTSSGTLSTNFYHIDKKTAGPPHNNYVWVNDWTPQPPAVLQVYGLSGVAPLSWTG